MSAFALRSIAVALMIVDHIGFFTGNSVFRIIGRLSLPIFAFLIANGFKYTRNVYKYAFRIFLFAIVSEFAFDFCFGNGKVMFIDFSGTFPWPELDNIFFTLFVGLCYLIINRALKKRIKHHLILSVPVLFVLAYAAAIADMDYGMLGVMWVALFGLFDVEEKKNRIPIAVGAILLAAWRSLIKSITAVANVSLADVLFVNAFIYSGSIGFMDKIQCFAALAILPILFYNGKSGMPKSRGAKLAVQYAFYLFYPVHIMILYAIFR